MRSYRASIAPLTRPAASRSATACASCCACGSGWSAASASSVAVTAWSFSCSASNASSSGCTSPPHGDLVTRISFAELVEHAALLRDQRRLSVGAFERQTAVEVLELPLQPPGLDPVHRPLVQRVGIPVVQPFGLELLVGARGGLAEREHRVVGDRLEHLAVGDELEFLGVDGVDYASLPRVTL